MWSKSKLNLLMMLLVCAIAIFHHPTADEASVPPNILLISIDDLATVLPAYGGQAITPNLDQLASESTVFLDAHVDAVLCNPSRISMLTGLRPTSTGIDSNSPEHRDWRNYLADPDSIGQHNYGSGIENVTTVYEHFKNNGYYVASVGKTFHSNQQLLDEPWWDKRVFWPFWPGIGWPENKPLHGLTEYATHTALDTDWGIIEQALHPSPERAFFAESDLPDYKITQDAQSIISELPTDQPFFLGVGFVLPHMPLYVPQRVYDLYDVNMLTLPEVSAQDLADIPENGRRLVSQNNNFYDQTYIMDDEATWKEFLAHYMASITYVDEQVGFVLSALERQGMLDNTIIVVWSDHGYHLGEKQHIQKYTLWDESTRSPLMIKAPAIPSASGTIVDVPVNAVDIFPTLVDLSQLEMPVDFWRDGRSLVPLIRNPDSFWPWPATTFLGNNVNNIVTNRVALRTSEWSYINYEIDNLSASFEYEELYNRVEDQNEWTNLLSPLNGDPQLYATVQRDAYNVAQGQLMPNQPPFPIAQFLERPDSDPVLIKLEGTDINSDFLIFEIVQTPKFGELYHSVDGVMIGQELKNGDRVVNYSEQSSYVFYVPTDFTGGSASDIFQFEVTDGSLQRQATIMLTTDLLSRLYLPTVRLDSLSED